MATIVKTPTSNNTNVAINNNDKNNNSPLNPPVSSLTSDTAITVDNEDREKDLERRLALLGGNTTDIITTTSTVTTAATATVTDEDNDSIEEKSEPKSVLSSPDNSNSDEKKKEEDQSSPPVLVEEKKKEEELKKNNDNVSLTPPEPSISNVTNTPPPTIEAAAVQPSLPEPPPVEIVKPAAELVKPKIAKTSSVMKREALMARIQAAQERAKDAQLKTAKEAQTTTSIMKPKESITVRKERMMKVLNGSDEVIVVKEEKEEKSTKVQTTSQLPPPPSFDIVEKQKQQENDRWDPKPPQPPVISSSPPPPSFAVAKVHTMQFQPPPPQERVPVKPSPPSFEEALTGRDENISTYQQQFPPPITAPSAPPIEYPISDEHQQQDQEKDPFEFDADGRRVSSEERQRMLAEQREIMRQIQKTSKDKKDGEVAARATSFDQRSNTAAAAAVGLSDTRGGERQREEVATEALLGISAVDDESPAVKADLTPSTVDIGDGLRVPLHGQEITRNAMSKGTSILVECLNCQSWMQIAEHAKLMLCPCCSVVSPVVKQTEVLTKDEAKQLMEDRKLAERLQSMEYEEQNQQITTGEGVRDPTLLSRSTFPAVAGRVAQADSLSSSSGGKRKSWWDELVSAVSSSTSSDSTSTTKPTNANASPAVAIQPLKSRQLYSASTGIGHIDDPTSLEQEGLLSVGRPVATTKKGIGRPAARVAERQPLFSCLVDSVTSTANALGTVLTTNTIEDDKEGNVHGVDTSSLLMVPDVGRGGQGGRSDDGRVVPGRT